MNAAHQARPPWLGEYRRLAAVNVLSNLTVPLAGLADTAMLGRLPEVTALAGVALAAVLFDVLYFGFGFLRMGTTGPVAQAFGRQDVEEQGRILGRGLFLGLIAGTLVVACRTPLAQVTFALLDGAAAVETAGNAYLQARILAAPLALANLVLLGWLLGRGQSGRALGVVATQNLVNILGNYILIVRLGMGAAGAGWATAAGQLAGFLVGLAVVLPEVALPTLWRGQRLHELRDALALNAAILIRTSLLVGAFTLFTAIAATLGTVALATSAVMLRVISIGSYLIDGLAYATETLAGRFWGAGDAAAENLLLRTALRTGLVCALAVALPPIALPQLLDWLVLDPAVQLEIRQVRFWLLPILSFGSAAYVLDGLFLGRAAGGVLRRSMTLSFLVFLLPALLARWQHSANLLYLALALLMVARAATLGHAVRVAPGSRPV